jgi:glyoxylase-like metal-dependent hydrolase (beta-lactamase superfamily II)
MADLTIWPIKMASWPEMDMSGATHGMNLGVKIEGPIIAFLIKGTREKILVDTGGGTPEWAEMHHNHRGMGAYRDTATALKSVGLHPDDIDLVICTHLHWDHCFNNDQFKNARILVQRDEMRYAIAPLAMHGLFYESQVVGMRPPWLRALERTEAVEGDIEIAEGVELVKVPGHTPGFQGVNVRTAKGNYFIASDFCPLFVNWEGTPSLKHIVSPIHVSIEDYYRSFEKVEKFADFVLPGHDIKVFEKECYP